jgi:GH25 family lysozyme M1 (1,4-beta-N-acetylmuramidase)
MGTVIPIGNNAVGVDISTWQNDKSTPQMYDPNKTRNQGGSFVGIKVSQSTWADPDYINNWKNCQGVLYRLPYHFLVGDVKPKLQAEAFWGLLEKNVDNTVLPLVCDFEWWQTIPGNAMDILYNFMERMKQLTNLPLGIYTAKSFWEGYGSKDDYWKQYALWLCDINGEVELPKPWDRFDFHQFTFKLDGLKWGAESLDLDGNYYNGSIEDMVAKYKLKSLFGAEPKPVSKFTCKVGGLNMRDKPNGNKIGVMNKDSVVSIEGVEVSNYRWIKTSVWIATDGFGELS